MEEDGVDLAVRRLDLGLVSVTGKGKSSSNSWKTLSSFTAPSATAGHTAAAAIAAHHTPPRRERGVRLPCYDSTLPPTTSATYLYNLSTWTNPPRLRTWRPRASRPTRRGPFRRLGILANSSTGTSASPFPRTDGFGHPNSPLQRSFSNFFRYWMCFHTRYNISKRCHVTSTTWDRFAGLHRFGISHAMDLLHSKVSKSARCSVWPSDRHTLDGALLAQTKVSDRLHLTKIPATCINHSTLRSHQTSPTYRSVLLLSVFFAQFDDAVLMKVLTRAFCCVFLGLSTRCSTSLGSDGSGYASGRDNQNPDRV